MKTRLWRMRPGVEVCRWLLPLVLLGGCQTMPRPDVPAEAARATGMADAITFQRDGEPIDVR